MKTRRSPALLLLAAIVCLVGVVPAWFGRHVSLEVQLQLYALLLTTSAIILGVAGAWIALVHASELHAAETRTQRLTNLLLAMLVSGCTIAVVLAHQGLHALLTNQPGQYPSSAIPWLRGISFYVWCVGSAAQIWCLLAVLPSGLYALGELENKQRHEAVLRGLPRRKAGS